MNGVFRWLLGCLVCVVVILVAAFLPHNTSTTERYDGLTVTEFRRHYPLDIEDGGIGQYLDTQVCIDAASVCARSSDLFYNYPKGDTGAPWLELCDPKTLTSRFFNRVTGKEQQCSNCDAEALRCSKSPQTGRWFQNGTKSSELAGYSKENRSTVRVFTYRDAGVTMHEFPSIQGVAYGVGDVIAKWFYGDKSRLAWIQCNDNRCVYYNVDFNTGESTQEATPCDSNDDLTLVLVDNRPEIRVDFEAKGDEICRNAEGKLAYPLGPERDRIVYPLRVDPPVEALDVKPAN
jgi:hypothetical protein